MGSVSFDPRSMENGQERVLLDGSSRTARVSEQNSERSTTVSKYQVNSGIQPAKIHFSAGLKAGSNFRDDNRHVEPQHHKLQLRIFDYKSLNHDRV